MVVDWNRYWEMCSDMAGPAFDRFRKKLLEGEQIATPQSAPAYLGALAAVLVTVCGQMMRNLELCAGENPEEEMADLRDRSILRRIVRERYFRRLSGIREMEIAREYFRTHVQFLEPDRQAMTKWLLSFRGRRGDVNALAEAAEAETEAFVREEIPRILEQEYGFFEVN
ncbi:MAG: hypothetical protein II640_10530 [Lachnospiraceae bacterium]|nr:hypothetical protein [Lachnospiraceae bacterium]